MSKTRGEKIDAIFKDKSLSDKDKRFKIIMVSQDRSTGVRPSILFPPPSDEEKVDIRLHMLYERYPELFKDCKIDNLNKRGKTLLSELRTSINNYKN